MGRWHALPRTHGRLAASERAFLSHLARRNMHCGPPRPVPSRTNHLLQALTASLAPRAKALRDGEIKTIDAVDLVPGDVIIIRLGDIVPADVKILEEEGGGGGSEETPMQVGWCRGEGFKGLWGVGL